MLKSKVKDLQVAPVACTAMDLWSNRQMRSFSWNYLPFHCRLLQALIL